MGVVVAPELMAEVGTKDSVEMTDPVTAVDREEVPTNDAASVADSEAADVAEAVVAEVSVRTELVAKIIVFPEEVLSVRDSGLKEVVIMLSTGSELVKRLLDRVERPIEPIGSLDGASEEKVEIPVAVGRGVVSSEAV